MANNKYCATALMSAICLLLGALAEAHHSFSAQYDAERPATIEGMVIKYEWHNPHVYFYLDVVDVNGQVTEWELEMSNTAVLQRAGWTRKTPLIGDMLKVEGVLARDNSPLINVRSVVRAANGEKLF